MSRATMGENVITVKDLVKVYDELRAVDGISFEVERGEVFAFLGPNGAGKTTSVEIIETIRTPTSGEVEILGYDIRKHRKEILNLIGVLPQQFSSFDRLTVKETVRYFACLFSSDCDIDHLIKLVNLEAEQDKLYMNLSGGLKQRVGIAVALVNDPEIVFLDEPTTGLDPRARRDVWEVIKGLRKDKKTVFLTTHYMEEAEVLADYVSIISKGKIIAGGSPTELIDTHAKTIHVTIRGGKHAHKAAEALNLPSQPLDNGNVIIEAKHKDQILDIMNWLKSNGIQYDSVDIRKANLEEVFLALTGEELSAGGEDE
jgi:ABC-2 type transport system ATP-binding protein